MRGSQTYRSDPKENWVRCKAAYILEMRERFSKNDTRKKLKCHFSNVCVVQRPILFFFVRSSHKSKSMSGLVNLACALERSQTSWLLAGAPKSFPRLALLPNLGRVPISASNLCSDFLVFEKRWIDKVQQGLGSRAVRPFFLHIEAFNLPVWKGATS